MDPYRLAICEDDLTEGEHLLQMCDELHNESEVQRSHFPARSGKSGSVRHLLPMLQQLSGEYWPDGGDQPHCLQTPGRNTAAHGAPVLSVFSDGIYPFYQSKQQIEKQRGGMCLCAVCVMFPFHQRHTKPMGFKADTGFFCPFSGRLQHGIDGKVLSKPHLCRLLILFFYFCQKKAIVFHSHFIFQLESLGFGLYLDNRTHHIPGRKQGADDD